MVIASAGGTITNATQLPITDTGNYFAVDNTNAALQQAGQKIGNLTLLTTTSNTDLVGAINENTSQLADIPSQVYITEKAKQADLTIANTNIAIQKARTDLLVSVANASFYQKSSNGITGALLVVASGAIAGQINLVNVTPLATGYTPINGDYVLLVYGVASGSAELIDARTGADGITYLNTGDSVRTQFKEQSEAISGVIKSHKNLLISTPRILSNNYDPNTHILSANVDTDVFQPITLFPNVTYYVRNVWGYFSPIKDINGNWSLLETLTDRPTNKSFTVATQSTLYLTIHKDYSNICILTTDIEMYNNATYANYYTSGPKITSEIDTLNKKFDDAIITHKNILISTTKNLGYLYDMNTHQLTANVGCDAFNPITLLPNVTYYIKNVWGVFCLIKNNSGVYSQLTTNEGMASSLSFSVTEQSTLYLTIYIDYAATCILTTDIEMYNKSIYTNYYTSTVLKGLNHSFTVEKDGSGDFTTLYGAIQYAEQFMDSKVYVGSGIWDVIAELGTTYINGVNAANVNRGIRLQNRIHIVFASNSKVVCNYAGSRQDTMDWLSGFNAGKYGFTLENANIEASNVRYTMHDERDSDTDAYKNSYINCHMKLDNSMKVGGGATNCIGGGLGLNGHILIDNCVFETTPTLTYPTNPPIVTYHNSAGANGKNHVTIKNSYLKGTSRIRLNWYGLSTSVTQCEISGCSMGSAILSQAETSDGTSPNVNMAITEWNNVVRV